MSEITEDEMGIVTEEVEDDGFNVVGRMSIQKWVDFGFDYHGEYVHLIADREARELRCYRSIGGDGENQRIKTVISDVKFRYYFEDEPREISYFYLTYMEAMSFMSFIELMDYTRQDTLSFEWSESDGGTMMDDEETGIEMITLGFTKKNGVERNLQIRSEWQSRRFHLMANSPSEEYE